MSPTWVERKVDDGRVAELEAAGYPRLLARLLALRGVKDGDGAAHFLEPELGDLAKATELVGMEAAAAEIIAALRAKKQIVVFGDYDCDGVAATAILVRALRALGGGADVRAFIPHRIREGFGFSRGAIERMLEENPKVGLIVTVDNGVNAPESIRALQGRGIRCVVTDHHLPGEELPACPVVNPKVGSSAALSEICGAAVAFFLASYLVQRAQAEGWYSGPKIAGPMLVLAGLATVTDVMPLVGQNRILVSQSLYLFHKLAPVGLRELYARSAKVATAQPTVRDYGFGLGPRVNAMGRIAHAQLALDLILTDDRERSRALAQQVDLKNVERKAIEAEMVKAAREMVQEGAAAQVIYLPEGHLGVAGIVAASVMTGLREPVPVCIIGADLHGSVRAPEGYNVYEALKACGAVLEVFGGHESAAGLTVKAGEVEHFREMFCAAARAQREARGEAFGSRVEYDAELSAADLTLEFAERVQQLEPFGHGNEEPVFLMRGVHFKDVRLLGADGKHLDVQIAEANVRAIWWRQGERVEALRKDLTAHDILFKVVVSDFGTRHIELQLLDLSNS